MTIANKDSFIDVHTHVVPANIPSNPLTDNFNRWPQMRCEECGHRTVYHGDKPFRTVGPNAWDITKRIEEMDSQGIGIQVLSPVLVQQFVCGF